MKTEAQLQRAIKLLSLFLSGEVKLPRQMSPEAVLNTQGVVRALQWTVGQIDQSPLDRLLTEIEEIQDGPGYNPHHSLIE